MLDPDGYGEVDHGHVDEPDDMPREAFTHAAEDYDADPNHGADNQDMMARMLVSHKTMMARIVMSHRTHTTRTMKWMGITTRNPQIIMTR